MGILEFIITILILLWLAGLVANIGGGLIHILLVIAIIVLVARFLGFRI